ncbi:MAG: hypothetical protein JRJ29_06415 [Deltaproteobacteria bacterium]|nr:hypothetical protein [Deltaproteobacteria bacterium]
MKRGFEGKGSNEEKANSKIILLAIVWIVALIPVMAQASWFIDPLKYHVSAHGQTSCLDCHEGQEDSSAHPDPDNVSMALKDFFDPESCISCHDEVPGDLEEGTHGAKRIRAPEEYQDCLSCHDPHEEPLLEVSKKGLDLAGSLEEQCGSCHEDKVEALPPPPEEDRPCYECHVVDPRDEEKKGEKINRFCLECHGDGRRDIQEKTGRKIQLIVEEDYQNTQHKAEACTVCHPQAPAYGHDTQQPGDCSQCHFPHDAKMANSVHLNVACSSCHLPGIEPYRDNRSGRVLWMFNRKPGEPLEIHQMIRGKDEESCRRCHHRGNALGAASMILPPKSIICMPCHSGTFSAGDWTTIISLIVFLGGLVAIFSLLLPRSSVHREAERQDGFGAAGPEKMVSSAKMHLGLKGAMWDVLLQRRLLKASAFRWVVHGLIFFPMVFRLAWGLIALATSLWTPQWEVAWLMLNKDHPVTAYLFDITGVMILLGAFVGLGTEVIRRRSRLSGLPGKDLLATGLLAGIVVLGFALEGARIALWTVPGVASTAFLGRLISGFFEGKAWVQDFYGYLWYAHALVTGAFVAYLPFSRLLHIILAPVLLVGREVVEKER